MFLHQDLQDLFGAFVSDKVIVETQLPERAFVHQEVIDFENVGVRNIAVFQLEDLHHIVGFQLLEKSKNIVNLQDVVRNV